MKTEIFFVRHGETASNKQQILCGRTDVPLTEVGVHQARCVAERLASLETLDYLYSSPLQRAWNTAELIGQRIGLSPQIVSALAELNFGDLEGHTLAQIMSDFPELYARIRDVTDDTLAFPNGESRREFHQRVRAVVRDLAGSHRGERIVVVAHGGVIGSAIAQLTDDDPNDWVRWQVHNCSVTHLEFETASRVMLHCWNDVSHLGLE